jgi:glycosyltransferase involved in cell wall biosynthesis
VFAGGRSERDFDVVVDALAGTGMTLVLVCDAHVRLREAKACDHAIEVHRDVPPEQFNALARGCDIVVVALRSTASPCGQLLLSFCMRERLALVVTESAGTRDYVIDGRTGLTVPVGDAAALRRTCQRLAADPALRQRLLDEAEAFVATLSFSSFARAIDALPLDRRG